MFDWVPHEEMCKNGFMSQIHTDKNTKSLEAQLAEITSKMEEYMRQVSELNNEKSKFTMENVELARQVDEADSTIMQLNKMKSTLARYVLVPNLSKYARCKRQKYTPTTTTKIYPQCSLAYDCMPNYAPVKDDWCVEM